MERIFVLASCNGIPSAVTYRGFKLFPRHTAVSGGVSLKAVLATPITGVVHPNLSHKGTDEIADPCFAAKDTVVALQKKIGV